MPNPEQMQAAYYTATASRYEDMHVAERDEHYEALQYIAGLMSTAGIHSVLDVGSGTGRTLRFFLEHHPHVEVRGLEPVEALRQQAHALGVPEGLMDDGSGYALPYPDDSFDAACEFGVLHHVRDPDTVIGEMMRVARKAIFLSDNNRFGQQGVFSGLVKLALVKSQIWPAFNAARTRGKGYMVSEDDGLFYSYSVYDSYPQLAGWADRVFFIGLGERRAESWLDPMLTHQSVLMCALRRD